MKRRREDAPHEDGLVRRHGPGEEARNDERRDPKDRPDAHEERVGSQEDDSLRPVARALLALAEQLRQEEAP